MFGIRKKKAQFAGNAVGNIITLIVGVGVSVLVLIFVGALGGQTYNLVEDDIDALGSTTVSGDTFTLLNGTAARLNHGQIHTDSLSIYNATGLGVIGLANFTINYPEGTVSMADAGRVANNTNLGANYTYGLASARNDVRNSIVSGFNALETTGNYTPLIVLAVVIALVLSLVLGFTAFGQPRGGGGAL